jgi:hypothetical protein
VAIAPGKPFDTVRYRKEDSLPNEHNTAWRKLVPDLFAKPPVVEISLDRSDLTYAPGDTVRATIAIDRPGAMDVHHAAEFRVR